MVIPKQDQLFKLKYQVFKDLTVNKKMYITDSLKFGGHFLMYKGDPEIFHATYLVVVCEAAGINENQFVAYQRSANSAKKDLLVAQVDGSKIQYCVVKHMRGLE